MTISNLELTQNCLLTNVAIVGMSGRFSGADYLDIFWENIVKGLETIKQFTEEELKAAGEVETLLNNPQYVKAKGIINDIECFDASFFGFNTQDARLTDPQHRLFLECAWEALESAGYVPEKYNGLLGVYASMADSTYLEHNLKNQENLYSLDSFQLRIATSLTTLSNQVSYRFNLKGPSVNLTTACSSSLVAIATACRSLIDYDCDMAIAGAAAIAVPQIRGYLFQEGGIESPDGHCRVFDKNSNGTVFSNGVGIIILKRLQDAIEDGDHIYSIIKGWNINNDGADKAGFAAPSVSGQAQCITSALALANVEADSISYIETHGTGTKIGDPIELKAMTDAFSITTNKKAFCAIGSVKPNIGHTDIAAGMPSIIKVALALKNKLIPPTLNYHEENPEINFADTPFYVNAQLQEWNFGYSPKRAGVNASGIGGTNAFLVLEEYQGSQQNTPSRPYQLIVLSAKTQTSLQKATQNLQQYLATVNTSEELANSAFTLQVGRADFNYRKFFVCKGTSDALAILNNPSPDRLFTHHQQSNASTKVTFMFPGQGSHYFGMAADLYQSELEFANSIDICCNYLEPTTQQAVRTLIFGLEGNSQYLNDTAIVQPALFIIEYALANLFISLAVKPDAMIGHSIGEYVAACLAGVMSLADALHIVCQRGQLMAKAEKGGMLAVALGEQELRDALSTNEISLAAVNSPTSCVISAKAQTIAALEKEFKNQNILTHRLRTEYAFHSHLMEPLLDNFRAIFNGITLNPPSIPFISNVTGKWITDKEATNPSYWVNHLRHTVKFLQGLETLAKDAYTFFLEIGPGKTLTHFARELLQKRTPFCIQNSLPGVKDPTAAQACFLQAIGQLWLHGIKIDWKKFYKHEKRSRVPLPTYAFDRQYFWIEPDVQVDTLASNEKQPYEKWFYEPSWIRTSFQCANSFPEKTFSTSSYCWVIFFDGQGIGATIYDILIHQGQSVVAVKSATKFTQLDDKNYEINFAQKEDYSSLVNAIAKITTFPLALVNLLPLTAEHNMAKLDIAEVETTIIQSFYSVLFFMQALIAAQYDRSVNILIAGNEMYSVLGNEKIYPAKASAVGPCRVIPQEQPLFKIKIVDLVLADCIATPCRSSICNQLILDTLAMSDSLKENIIAYRNQYRWIQDFRPLTIQPNESSKLREDGVYLFIGGIGGISLTLAEKIAETAKKTHLIFIYRSDFPSQAEWQDWLIKHPETNAISKKINQLLKIAKLANITLYQVDVTNPSQLEKSIKKIKKKFPVLHGVIHAAGVAGGGLAQLKTVEMANKVFAPKISGTYLLVHLLQKEPLDFFVLCSSISSVLGLASQVDYCAANACLDAFAQVRAFTKETSFISISWNTWREVGMAVETASPTDLLISAQYNSISPPEGATIFSDTMNSLGIYNHVVISTIDLQALRSNNKNIHKALPTSLLINPKEEMDNFVSPRGHVETTLADIWQEILGINRVSVLDDFFMLGGHSLAALKLLTKLESRFNVKISLQALQEAKTIQKIATIIDKKLSPYTNQYSLNLVPIRSDGHHPPLFLMHPVGGNVFCYLPLAKHLTFDCPIYGLQDLSQDPKKLVCNSIEEMATHYLQAIREVQPNGPYLLGGLSFGATLSIEMAKQLVQQGETVRPLLLFDGWAKFSKEQHLEKLFLQQMLELSKSQACDEAFAKLSWARMRLLLNYQIPIILAKLILFKAEELLPEYKSINNPYNHWIHFTDKDNIELYVTPGNHETILAEPNVITLANTLDTILPKIIANEQFSPVEVI